MLRGLLDHFEIGKLSTGIYAITRYGLEELLYLMYDTMW